MLATPHLEELRSAVRKARESGDVVGCVPTMGALHAGHLSLVEAARKETDFVVGTIFVNPTQFAPGEDFDRYPRTLESDLVAFRDAAVDCVFHPDVETMYPRGATAFVDLEGPALPLEGAHRPGHFRGVATIVLKLFEAVQPDIAFFGQKDYQQQLVIRRMCADLLVPVEIRSCPIVREPDGLALSSRNAYLSSEERTSALALSRSLRQVEELFHAGERTPRILRERMHRHLASTPGVAIDYAVIADPETLAEPAEPQPEMVALVAARVGTTRLIDNTILRS